ncbi:UPF0182 family membrane protein [Virgisporangium aurantiacum]|uniref:UPF0182 protein Vau01_009750 n=1 Tax=Virgisporangium aurantiacum TaxID=175570 RepID=A0A8J3YXF2_9ACTN|nr:UPF0182 family protein [Virgisporangium aurantiacum]GIJ53459.1 UPF0182 protein [Virgisporangium aurantiacum]
MRTPLSRVSRRGRVTLVVLAVLLVLVAITDRAFDIWADWLWYDETGYTDVYSGILTTRALLLATFGLGVGLIVAVNLYLAYRMRPLLRPHSAEQHALDRYRMFLLPRMGTWIAVIAGLVGLFAGIAAQNRWQQWLLFINGGSFGVKDPHFGVDVSFYVFEYPFYRYLLGVGFFAVVVSLLGALGLHYLLGGVRLQGAGDRMTPAARAHLTALVAAFVLLKAAAYFLDRRGLLLGQNPSVDNLNGASYTAISALLPAKEILAWISLVVAVAILVFSNAFARNLVWPGVALALLGISAVVIGGIIPAGVQSFTVKPSPREKESPYIQYSINGTRAAYGIADVKTEQYSSNVTVPPGDLLTDTSTVPNVRLLDPAVVNDTYTQKQQVRGFYEFADKLDIDRYEVNKTTQDYVVGVREINYDKLSPTQSNWQNKHTVFTHGYGFVAAPANRLVCGGLPYFVSGFLGEQQRAAGEECQSSTEQIPTSQPRVYYGERMSEYAIVGKSGGNDSEFDRPSGNTDQYFTYDGKGGIGVGSLSRRILYATHMRETNFLLSSVFNDDSKIMYVREPRERVEKVAPFLTIDGDPYPAVVNGRVLWIVDGYTTASTYPYSTKVDLRAATTDATTGEGTFAQQRQDINYLRNSVKATVDAYDGTVTLYSFDDKDPVLKAWNKAFGGKLVKPSSQIPPDLQNHLRYPVDQFKVQRDLLSRFHVTAPNEFFSQQDFWQVPADPANSGQEKQPPYYVLAKMPVQDELNFQLTAAVVPRNRANLAALVSGYYVDGKPVLQVYELPDNTNIQGPAQVHQKMVNQDQARQDITLLESSDSRPVFGNLLSLPIAGGMLYVQPLYIRSTSQDNSFPFLNKVLVNFGDYAAYANNLQQGLEQLVAQANNGRTPGGAQPPTGVTQPPGTGTQPGANDALMAAAAKVQSAITEVRAAQQSGDFERYGRALKALDDAMKAFEDAQKAAAAAGGTQPSTNPSGSPPASAPPSAPASSAPPG